MMRELFFLAHTAQSFLVFGVGLLALLETQTSKVYALSLSLSLSPFYLFMHLRRLLPPSCSTRCGGLKRTASSAM
jgi:hypothetical protein